MHRIYRALFGLILLATPAVAGDGKQAAAQAVEAARGLQHHAAEVAAAGQRIDFAKAPAADYFQRVFDSASLAALPAPAAADMPWVSEWFSALNSANQTIVFFGTDTKRPALQQQGQIGRNLAEYEDQFALATAFIQNMFARLMTTALDFLNTLSEQERNSPVRQDGLAKMRHGYVDAVEGSLRFLAAGNVKPANIRIMTAALRENAGTWSKIVPPADRGRLAKLIATARDKAGDAQSSENLRAILSTLEAK